MDEQKKRLRLRQINFTAVLDIVGEDGKVTGSQVAAIPRPDGSGSDAIVVFEAEIPEAFYDFLRKRNIQV